MDVRHNQLQFLPDYMDQAAFLDAVLGGVRRSRKDFGSYSRCRVSLTSDSGGVKFPPKFSAPDRGFRVVRVST